MRAPEFVGMLPNCSAPNLRVVAQVSIPFHVSRNLFEESIVWNTGCEIFHVIPTFGKFYRFTHTVKNTTSSGCKAFAYAIYLRLCVFSSNSRYHALVSFYKDNRAGWICALITAPNISGYSFSKRRRCATWLMTL